MRFSCLTATICAVLAVASAAAGAVALNPKGLGQVLIYPYYTVNKGQDTLLTIINTDANGKLVQVRFREGRNGRETLAFHLFLSAHDSWTGVVTAADAGISGARLGSSDASCVDPEMNYPAAFSTAGFSADAADGGPTIAERTREGMIEMIALADIRSGSPTDAAIAHGNGDPGCSLPASIVGDLTAPTSGLIGSGAIVNVGEGTFYAYDAGALVGFASTPQLTPGQSDLASARSSASTFPQGAIATVVNGAGEPMKIDYARGIDAVSAVFMADYLYNDYLVSPALGANTDWIITFPTKQFYVDKKLYPSTVTAPFETRFAGPPGLAASTVDVPTMDLFDREGHWGWSEDLPNCHPAPLTFCPFPLAVFEHQVNVLTFLPPNAASSGVFGSRLAASPLMVWSIDQFSELPISEAGWLKLDLAQGGGGSHALTEGLIDGRRVDLLGLPVVGFMAYNIINSQAAPGRLANYGGTFRHRSTFSCVSDTPPNGIDPCT